jgi:hypothetical protein
MQFKRRTLNQIADMICGNAPDVPDAPDPVNFFVYRTSTRLTEFFEDIDREEYVHDGTTRKYWVADRLADILSEPQPAAYVPPEAFAKAVSRLMDQEDATNEEAERPGALAMLNKALAREDFEAFYGQDRQCYLRHVITSTVATAAPNPHRPLTPVEQERRDKLAAYLDRASEDQLIEEVLLPLFRQLGYARITPAGHKDKALEYGKDIWMYYTLPTQHRLYFGIQVKKDKLDAAGRSKGSNANVAEVHAQLMMMLGHEIFDPEIGKRVLVDHAYIVAGGEITKAARAWLGNAIDASQRRQIIFMDREDILNLYVVANLPVPGDSVRPLGGADPWADEPPL